MSERPQRARAYELFVGALDLPPPERQRYLDEQASGDGALRAEVEGMLGVALRDGLDTAALTGTPQREE